MTYTARMATTTPLTIGDGSGWHFVNGAWTDGGDGALTVPPGLLNAEVAPLQGAHFAFDRSRALQDCRVSFDFLLRGHSDTGIILRARDESHFYLVHFPNCAQRRARSTSGRRCRRWATPATSS